MRCTFGKWDQKTSQNRRKTDWQKGSQSNWIFSSLFWRKNIEQFHWLRLKRKNRNRNSTHCKERPQQKNLASKRDSDRCVLKNLSPPKKVFCLVQWDRACLSSYARSNSSACAQYFLVPEWKVWYSIVRETRTKCQKLDMMDILGWGHEKWFPPRSQAAPNQSNRMVYKSHWPIRK